MALGKWTKLTAFVGIPSLSVATYYYSTLSKTTPKQALAALNSKEFKAFTLKEILPVNHNTAIFRFQLPGEATELGLPTTSCIVTRFQDGTKEDGSPNFVIRPYTPVEDSGLKSKGLFDLIIKKYPNGPMSSHIFKLIPGQTLEMKGPIPKFPYTPNEFSRIGLIAGGTGITPMLQLIKAITENPADKTEVNLIFANVTPQDVLLKSYLDDLTKEFPRIKVRYTVDKPSADWKGDTGFVSEEMLKADLPAPGQGKVFICGPNPMLGFISGTKAPDYSQGEVGGILKKLGYSEKDVFKF